MTIHQHATIEDTVYFWFASNDTAGSGDDGANPAADVRLAGAAAGAIPVLSPTPVLLTHVNYPPGCHEVAVAATVANGFVATNTYSVFSTLLVDAQNPTGFVGSFTLDPIIADVQAMANSVAASLVDDVFDEDVVAAHGTADTSGLLIRVLGQGISGETHDADLLDQIKRVISVVESQRGAHTHQAMGNIFYVDPVNGGTHGAGNRGGISDPYLGIQDCHDNAITDSNHDLIILVAGAAAGITTLTEDVTLTKRYFFIRGPGRDFVWTRAGAGDTITITADGIELSGFQLNTAGVGAGNGIQITDADFHRVHLCWINDTRGDGVSVLRGENVIIENNVFTLTGQGGSGQGVDISGAGGSSNFCIIRRNVFRDCQGDAIQISGGSTDDTTIVGNLIEGSTAFGIDIGASSTDAIVTDNRLANNTSGNINDSGTTTVLLNNEQWAKAGVIAEDLDDLPTSAEISTDNWDEILTGATHNIANSSGKILRIVQEGGFEHASVWIDTTNGTPGGEGTIVDPVDSITAALVVAATFGFTRLEYATGSSDTLVAAVEGFCIRGFGFSLALGGQSISGSRIDNASVTGICTGATPPEFVACAFGDVTLPSCTIRGSSFGGTMTLSSAGNYYFDNCYSAVAGTSAPILDFGAAVGSTNMNMRHYSGGVDIRNLGAVGTDNMSLEGFGQLILNANCVGGTIAIRGLFTVTDSSGGAVVLSEDARYDVDQIDTQVRNLLTQQMVESYAAKGVSPTLAQALFQIQQTIGDFSVSGTVLTAKKLDGVTTAATYTLDDAADPTSRTRAT